MTAVIVDAAPAQVTRIVPFVKSRAETLRTYKEAVCINATARTTPEFRVRLPTDFHVVIPLVLQGLPTWAESRSTKKCRNVPWRKGSVICIKGGTDFICTQDGRGIYIIIGGESKKQP